MKTQTNGAWSKSSSAATLEQLRSDFPGYTDNELYAIWCHQHGRIPRGPNEKVDLDQWRIHAQEDGQHVREGGFRISRAFYGRAVKARSGVRKPRSRRRREAQGDGALAPDMTPLSERALKIARDYDRAAAILRAALSKHQDALDLVAKLGDVEPLVVDELAGRDGRVRALLEAAAAPRRASVQGAQAPKLERSAGQD